jgi:hypothetical protein
LTSSFVPEDTKVNDPAADLERQRNRRQIESFITSRSCKVALDWMARAENDFQRRNTQIIACEISCSLQEVLLDM